MTAWFFGHFGSPRERASRQLVLATRALVKAHKHFQDAGADEQAKKVSDLSVRVFAELRTNIVTEISEADISDDQKAQLLSQLL